MKSVIKQKEQKKYMKKESYWRFFHVRKDSAAFVNFNTNLVLHKIKYGRTIRTKNKYRTGLSLSILCRKYFLHLT